MKHIYVIWIPLNAIEILDNKMYVDVEQRRVND